MVTIATWAFPGSFNVECNLRNLLSGMRQAAHAGAELVVFPESSLQGYPTEAIGQQRMMSRAYETAEALDGPQVTRILKAAAELNIHVVFGLTERGNSPGELYNTAVIAAPTGLIGSYRKVHLSLREQVIWRPGNDWPVFNTIFGRIGLLICYDQAWPESCRELVLGGAELLIMPTAWPFMPQDDEANPLSIEQYLLYSRARAADSVRWFVSSNYVGTLGGSHYFGHSQIIDPHGRVVAESGADGTEHLALADVDIRGGIEAAYARGIPTGDKVWRDRRPSTYRRLREDLT